MKKIICLAIASTVVIITACSPKANKAVASTTPVASPNTTAPVGPALPPSSNDVTAMQVDAAKTKYPDATLDALKKGYDVYHGDACTSCHGVKRITNFSAEELPGIIDEMAHKAKISATEKDAVLKYVMGVRLAAK